MIALPPILLEELHKLSSDGSTIALLEIPEHSIYLARNLEDVVWNGLTWSKFWFEFEAVESASSDNVPELQLQTSNVGGIIEAIVLEHDNFSDSTCIIYFLNSNCLTETTPITQVTFQIMKPICDNKTVSLKLSAENPLLLSFPSWHYHGSICQYREYKGSLCGYTGDAGDCSRTLKACLDRGNQKRFGAQLGLSDDYAELDDEDA